MFVPVPEQNFNIYVRYEGAEWQDVFNEVVTEHQCNRFGGHENISLAFSSAIRYYVQATENANLYMKDDEKNISLVVLKKIIKQYLTLKNGTAPKKTEIIIRVKDVRGDKDYSHYYLS